MAELQAAVAAVGARWQEQEDDRVLAVLRRVLPEMVPDLFVGAQGLTERLRPSHRVRAFAGFGRVRPPISVWVGR
jgi:hypothetical protein